MNSAAGIERRTAGWRMWLTGVVAVVLLPAVPALATLIFLEDWQVKTTTRDGAPKPVITASDSPVGTQLRVDMGQTSNIHAKSDVRAERTFRLTSDQVVELRHAFATIFRDANVKVKAKINRGGARLQTHERAKHFDTRTLSTDEASSRTLKAGKVYKIKISITYLNHHGFWNNASAHTFSITGV